MGPVDKWGEGSLTVMKLSQEGPWALGPSTDICLYIHILYSKTCLSGHLY